VNRAADSRNSAMAALRFGIAGGANTLITGALLSVLAHFIEPALAYTIVFAAGIALSTYLAGSFVFRARMSRRQVIYYVALYVVVFAVGLLVLQLAFALGMPDAYSGLVVLVTAPLTFLGGRVIFWKLDKDGRRRTTGPTSGTLENGASE
jgi:putative flippase GtrA